MVNTLFYNLHGNQKIYDIDNLCGPKLILF
jgi:hypothetical protein